MGKKIRSIIENLRSYSSKVMTDSDVARRVRD